MIFYTISKWNKPYKQKSHWSTYYNNDIESPEYLKDKEAKIRNWLKIIKPKSVLDLGANTGKFTFIAAEYAERVISIERDEKCVDEIEDKISKTNSNIFTLLGDVANPSQTIGFLNSETGSIYNRCSSDMVLGLALVHHLYISNRLNFDQISLIFASLSNEYLIVEFIPITDNKVQILIKSNPFDATNYSEAKFTNALFNWFFIKEAISLKDSGRILYILKRKNYE